MYNQLIAKCLSQAHLSCIHILTDSCRAMVWGGTLVTEQAMDWDITITHSATSMNYGILLQGFGGVFAVPLIEAYGR
jgi:hypothetical protein